MNHQARKAELSRRMDSARRKTLWLLDQIPDEVLKIRVHNFYSPIGWHFGHIAMTEEFWTLTQALHRQALYPQHTFLFANIPENPKDNRICLPDRHQITAYMAATRDSVLTALYETDLCTTDPLLADGYAWDFAHQHECQHQETIAELLQLLCKYTAPARIPESAAVTTTSAHAAETAMASIAGGAFLMGSDDCHGYDNEKRAHHVEVASFRLDVTPVTSAHWMLFIRDHGYTRHELWTPEGWAWRHEEEAELPEYWFRRGSGYGYFGPAGARAIDPEEPVTGISWHEANAYARWKGKRLPTEAEWEYAAAFDPAIGRSRCNPWETDAKAASAAVDCGLQGWGPKRVGASSNLNSFGIHDMVGKVWEWTSTPFLPYPGFVAFPYDGYSKEHMDGGHYVCRGGSWATDPRILRFSFRNWYVPTYRQGFLGLRLAADG